MGIRSQSCGRELLGPNMKVKTIEIRDRATFIPALCVEMMADPGSQSAYLLRRAGYDDQSVPLIGVTSLSGGKKMCVDPYDWGDRTMQVAHDHIAKNWEALDDGSVVDVEFILGETQAAKASERAGG